ncbi:hypothetical protein Tco_0883996 [Tanacetum coccineum]
MAAIISLEILRAILSQPIRHVPPIAVYVPIVMDVYMDFKCYNRCVFALIVNKLTLKRASTIVVGRVDSTFEGVIGMLIDATREDVVDAWCRCRRIAIARLRAGRETRASVAACSCEETTIDASKQMCHTRQLLRCASVNSCGNEPGFEASECQCTVDIPLFVGSKPG